MIRKQILIVDDDPDIQVILKDNLELDGYVVKVASSGRQVLSMLDAFQDVGSGNT